MRKKLLIAAIATIALLTVVFALVINQFLISEHMYPQDVIHEDSNLVVSGTVTSFEQNHKTQGMTLNSYHVFRYWFRLNISKVNSVSGDLADSPIISTENGTVNGWSTLGIGYDNLDNPQLVIGQFVTCKGYYASYTDTPYSFILAISPSISESHLNLYYS